ncbi:MAG: type II toxin-antitoxin system RelE/ParE family toxin [Acidobacteria bacterium]|nr:type II toxin-antitoxin system RelE/ParE family toxin [Acidobacteriota bacterium]
MTNEIRVLQMPPFKRAYKRLHPNQRRIVDMAVSTIVIHPEIGQLKRGDLDSVYVHKFPCLDKQMLLAYEWDPKTRILLALGVHENFYRNLKKQFGISS